LPGPKDRPHVFAGFTHDDGGRLIVMCDKEKRRISISLVEPRAQWQADESIKVTTRSDVPISGISGDGTQMHPSTGVVIKPTQLVIYEESTWDLFVMGH
jgi:hypothetical protein